MPKVVLLVERCFEPTPRFKGGAVTNARKITSVSEYLAAAAPEARPVLEQIRAIVKDVAPAAEECISYQMPAFRHGRIFIYFAAFKNHIGIYPPVKGDMDLEADLLPYRGPKGNLKFPLAQSMPFDLIRRVVESLFREYGA